MDQPPSHPYVEAFAVADLKGKLALRLEPWSVGITMVVDGAGRSCATISADLLDDGTWYLARCLVQEPYRSKGVGAFLVARLQQLVTARDGFKQLVVEPGGYAADLNRQRSFYLRQGFARADDGAYVWPSGVLPVNADLSSDH